MDRGEGKGEDGNRRDRVCREQRDRVLGEITRMAIRRQRQEDHCEFDAN